MTTDPSASTAQAIRDELRKAQDLLTARLATLPAGDLRHEVTLAAGHVGTALTLATLRRDGGVPRTTDEMVAAFRAWHLKHTGKRMFESTARKALAAIHGSKATS